MPGAADQLRDVSARGLAWPVGVEQVRAMIAAGEVGVVTADAVLAARYLASARDDLGAAETILASHPGPAFAAAYDATRKGATALLEHQGLRVSTGEGGHAKVVELVRAQLGADQGRTLGAMRRLTGPASGAGGTRRHSRQHWSCQQVEGRRQGTARSRKLVREVHEQGGLPAAAQPLLERIARGLIPHDVAHAEGIDDGTFGPRASLKRHDAKWQIADTLLPFDPRTLEART